MRQKTERHQEAADRTIKDIRRQTRRKYTAEDKIRIVLSGLKGEDSIAELCRSLPSRQAKRRREGGRYRPEPILQLVEALHGRRCLHRREWSFLRPVRSV